MDNWTKIGIGSGVLLAGIGTLAGNQNAILTGGVYVLATLVFVIEDSHQPIIRS